MSETPEYTTHNYDAVNNQIQEIANREKAKTTHHKLRSKRLFFIYAAISFISIGLMAVLLSWAYRIIIDPPLEKEIVRPEIIEKEVVKVVRVPLSSSVSDLETSYAGPKDTNNEGNKAEVIRDVVTNYNTFKHINTPVLEDNGIPAVNTGWKYSSSDQEYPESQYCYFNKYQPGKKVPLFVNIAEIDEQDNYVNLVDRSLSYEVGVTQDVLEKAQEYCQWASR